MTDKQPPGPSSPLPPLWRSLGLRDPSALTDEADAPPVDPEVLAGLAAGRLGPAESEHARLLLARFRTWRDAYARMLRGAAITESEPAIDARREGERTLDWLIGVARGLTEGVVADPGGRVSVATAFDGYRRGVSAGRSAGTGAGSTLWRFLVRRVTSRPDVPAPAPPGAATVVSNAGGGETLPEHRSPGDEVEAARRLVFEVMRCLRLTAGWADEPLLARIAGLALDLHTPAQIARLLDEPEDFIAAGLAIIEGRWAAPPAAEGVPRG